MAKKGWDKEPARHSLAAKGVKTKRSLEAKRAHRKSGIILGIAALREVDKCPVCEGQRYERHYKDDLYQVYCPACARVGGDVVVFSSYVYSKPKNQR